MIDVNKFEDRIVKFNRISEDDTTPTSAEVRQLECEHNSNIPRSVTARFVEPLNVVMTLAYDRDTETFRGPVAGDILESDFDIDDFIKNSKKNKPTIIYCYKGISSQKLAHYLSTQGFENAYSVDGGFEDWKE